MENIKRSATAHDVFGGIYKLFYVWIVISFIVIHFDLGKTWIGMKIAGFGMFALPRVREIAESSALSMSCAFVMTLAWLWPILVLSRLIFLLLNNPRLATEIRQPRLTNTMLIGGWILFLLAIILYVSGEIDVDFDGESGIDLLYRFDLNPYLIIIWGGGIWIISSIVIAIPAAAAVDLFHRRIK